MATMSKLVLTVFSAEGLHEHGKIKKQDPYVIVEVGERTFKTKSDRSAGANPVWNEELVCEVPAGVTHANFTLHDHNYLVRDDIIGVAKYDFTRAGGQEDTIPVFAKTGEPAGHMKVRAVYQGHGTGTGHGATAAGLGAGAAGAAAMTGHHNNTPGMPGQTATTAMGQHHMGDRSAMAGAATGAGMAGQHHGTAMPGAAGAGFGTAQHTTTGTATRGMPGFTGDMTNLAGNTGTVCDQKFYTVEEDRPIVKEVKQYVREHHPVEREMVKQTMTTGREKAMATGPSELVNVKERIVDRTVPKPCP